METKLLPCPFCGSTKICMDGGDSIYWCRCLDCGAMDVFDVWQKRALSERHQRLVEAAREMLNAVTVLCGDEYSCFSTCSLANECDEDDGYVCLLVARLKAALEGEG